jgi:DNA-binding NtrC family response regulator
MNAPILLVEDDADLSAEMEDSLARRGFACRICTSIAAAEQAFDESRPDIVLSDLRLPDGDGLGLFRRRAPEAPQARWLMMSADRDRVRRMLPDAARLGFAVYDKPMRLRTLLDFVRGTGAATRAELAAALVQIRLQPATPVLARLRDRLATLGLVRDGGEGGLAITAAGERYFLAEAQRLGLVPSHGEEWG